MRLSTGTQFIIALLLLFIPAVITNARFWYQQQPLVHQQAIVQVGFSYRNALRATLQTMMLHEITAHRFLTGDSAVDAQLIAASTLVKESLQQLIALEQKNASVMQRERERFSQAYSQAWSAKALGIQWQQLIEALPHLTAEQSDLRHIELIQIIRVKLNFLAGLRSDDAQESQILSTLASLLRIPYLQEQTLDMILRPSSNPLKEVIVGELAVLKGELADQFAVFKTYNLIVADPKHLLLQLQELIDTLPQNIEELVPWLTASFMAWNDIGGQLTQLLSQRHHTLITQQRIANIALISLFATCIVSGCYLLWRLLRPFYSLLLFSRSLVAGNTTERYSQSDVGEAAAIGHMLNNLLDENKATSTQLQAMEQQLNLFIAQMTQTANHQQYIITEQETITRQIATTANEIASTAHNLTATLVEVNAAAIAASSLALKGRYNLQQLEQIMKQLVGASNHLVSTLNHLDERMKGITRILAVIVHLADRTNMLSLNTALEAVKNKQMEHGFGLIATEMGRLADQTAHATLDIEQLFAQILSLMNSSVSTVHAIADEILNSVDRSSFVQQHFAEIIDRVQYLSGKFSSVTTVMQAQLHSVSVIEASLHMLQKIAEDSSGTMHQFHTALKKLRSNLQSE
jgi:methyl-accepting chemotaxis protein